METGKYMSSVKVGPKGQIVIPKEVREMFQIQPGDTMLILPMPSGASPWSAIRCLNRSPTPSLPDGPRSSIQSTASRTPVPLPRRSGS